MGLFSLDNGKTMMNRNAIYHYENKINEMWEVITGMMDDDIREKVHSEIAPCSNIDFLKRYLELSENSLVVG